MLIHWQNSSISRSVRLFTACLSLSALLPLIALQIQYCPQAQAFGKKKEAQAEEGTAKAEKSEKSEESGKSEKSEKPAKTEKAEKAEKAEKPEKVKKISKEEAAEQEALEKEYAELQAKLAADLKLTKTPFNTSGKEEESTETKSQFSSMKLSTGGGRTLGHKILAARLYMPGRLVIGKPTEFTVKGKPGYWTAVAMADRDTGAKPIYGHNLRLGPDRKVIALGKIPDSGVIAFKYFAPAEGDLIGQSLYFEAVIWPEGKLEAMEMAQTVSSELTEKGNGILVTAELEKKKGIKLVPDSAIPPSMRSSGAHTLDSGKL